MDLEWGAVLSTPSFSGLLVLSKPIIVLCVIFA